MEVNTKMILAVVGAGWLIIDKVSGKDLSVSKDFFYLSLLSVVISVWALFTTVFNQTSDGAFVTYFVSVWVWLGAAYAVVRLIQKVHGDISIEIIGNYLIAVCVVQCIVAYLMSVFPVFGSFVDSLMGEGLDFMSATENRMHGLGAALDPAGLRFSAILVICTFLTAKTDFNINTGKGVIYLTAFVIISLIGNIIARSTTIGMISGVVLFCLIRWPRKGYLVFGRSWSIIGAGLIATILLASWLYRIDPGFRNNFRFGFEGFVSLAETGRWKVHSNEILKGMVVWPESLKTWIIGDGFFESPQDLPDYFGQIRSGFYMQTDIGYLRYVFYFGIVGLLGMVVVFIQMTTTCVKWFREYKWLFLMLLLINLIGWIKVSSDIIMVFAPFLIMAYQKAAPCTSSTT